MSLLLLFHRGAVVVTYAVPAASATATGGTHSLGVSIGAGVTRGWGRTGRWTPSWVRPERRATFHVPAHRALYHAVPPVVVVAALDGDDIEALLALGLI